LRAVKLPLASSHVRLRHSKSHAAECADEKAKKEAGTYREGDLEFAGRAKHQSTLEAAEIAEKCPATAPRSEIDIRFRVRDTGATPSDSSKGVVDPRSLVIAAGRRCAHLQVALR